MLNVEQIFRLSTLATLSVMFVAVTAIAEKNEFEEKKEETNIMSKISLIQEAELINSGALSPYNLTRIGLPSEDKN